MRVKTIKIGKADYLQVKDRVKMWRDENPDAAVETQVLILDPQLGYAAVKASVTLPGGAHADGMGSAGRDSMGKAGSRVPAEQYLEMAETRAIGRALGRIGYGTEDALDEDSPVDSPVEARQNTRPAPPGHPQPAQMPSSPARSNGAVPALEQKLSAIDGYRQQLGWAPGQVRRLGVGLGLPERSTDYTLEQAGQLLAALEGELADLAVV